MHEEDRPLRWRIALALAALDDERAVEPLVESLRLGGRSAGSTWRPEYWTQAAMAALEAMTIREAKRALSGDTKRTAQLQGRQEEAEEAKRAIPRRCGREELSPSERGGGQRA